MNDLPSLPLQLHGRYGRKNVFASVGITYTQQNRSLNTGLSPECPDGGFFIFVTLNKETLDPRHDYEDQLFREEFVWVTRRGRTEDHKDYVKLRLHGTRVSLFVRLNTDEKFLYAGELVYRAPHRQFQDPDTGEVQQSYTWRLKTPVPDELISELTLVPSPAIRKPTKNVSQPERNRRPSTFDDYKRMFSYALGSLERRIVPGHHNFQVRLKKYLGLKEIVPEFERDFVDVDFILNGERFIGEIKVTGFLGLNQAFRIAMGQLLEYAHLRFKTAPHMIMFLDGEPDAKRVALATKFSIAVVVETGDKYHVLNPEVTPMLTTVFQSF